MATKYYDQKAKERTKRYQQSKRDMLTLNLPKGTKDRWRERAAQAGEKSLTAYISRLVEQDIEDHD